MSAVDQADWHAALPVLRAARARAVSMAKQGSPALDGQVSGRVPALPRTYVPPLRLWHLLDEAATETATLLVAPAGAGKTLGVAGWVEDRAGVDAPVRWLVASRETSPGDLRRAVGAVRPGPGPALRRAAPGLVVVDDAEHLRQGCLRTIDDLLDERPDGVRLIVLTRRELGVNLVVAQLVGALTVLRGEVLRVPDDDARTLVRMHAPDCPDEVVERIVDEAEGWCAALVLGARAVRARGPDAGRRTPVLGAEVSDLVARDVFAGLSPRERHLLLAIVHESVVTAATAARLANDPGAGELLERLEAAGLLVSREPLPAGGEVFRVHSVLADVVRRRFAAGGVDVARARSTIARAAGVDVESGDLVAGLRRATIGGGPPAAAAILDEHGLAMVLRGEGAQVRAAGRASSTALDDHPGARLALGLERSHAGDTVAAARHLAAVSAAPPGMADAADGAIARLLRARLGLEPVGPACEAGLAVLGEADAYGVGRHALLLSLVGEAQLWTGRLGAGEASLGAAAHAARGEGSVGLEGEVLAQLSIARYTRGRVADAARLADQAARLAPPTGERGAIAGAHALVALHSDPWSPAAERAWADPGPHLLARFWADVGAALGMALRGHVDTAGDVLAAPVELPEVPPTLAAARQTARLLVAVAADDEAALRDAGAQLSGLGADGEALLADGLLAVVRRDLRRGLDLLEDAVAVPMVPQPDALGLALVCAAQVAAALGEPASSGRHLARAVARAARQDDALPLVGWLGHVPPVHALLGRVVVPLSPWTAGVIAAARRAGSLHSLATRTTPTAADARRAATATPFPLTPRERDVLERLARGASYADMAADLVLSANTVKTHVASLYAKLGAGRRSEALATARANDLL